VGVRRLITACLRECAWHSCSRGARACPAFRPDRRPPPYHPLPPKQHQALCQRRLWWGGGSGGAERIPAWASRLPGIRTVVPPQTTRA
jgi:hypothetical protein